MEKQASEKHKLLVTWAAECAEHVLSIFEKSCSEDDRPRVAIEAARAWVIGKLKISEVRKLALAAHAAARDSKLPRAIAAARSAGHAAATVHVPTHAKYSAIYAAKATPHPETEINWQLSKLPDNLKLIIQLNKKPEL